MSVQTTIESKLTAQLEPQHLQVINESNNHNVPPGSESHFKIVAVSDAFLDKSLIQRHRIINKILETELNGIIHALAMHTYTPGEWQEAHGNAPMSPPCLGGGKA